MITDERIISLALDGALELWANAKKKLEQNPESKLAQFRERKFWEQYIEIQNIFIENKRYELRKEYCEVRSKSANLSAKQLEDTVSSELGDSYKVINTFASLGEARVAFEKAKETCSTHFIKQSVNFYRFDVVYIQEIPLDIDGDVDYDEMSDIVDIYVKDI